MTSATHEQAQQTPQTDAAKVNEAGYYGGILRSSLQAMIGAENRLAINARDERDIEALQALRAAIALVRHKLSPAKIVTPVLGRA